ncbi:MAG: NHL repeat-containing protein [Bacteroidota bacterium]
MKLTTKLNANYCLALLGVFIIAVSGCSKSKVNPVVQPEDQNQAGHTYTFAGSDSQGLSDATGKKALFNNPNGIAIDAAGNLYVADQGNNAIRKITAAGVVTTLAGNGSAGAANGKGTAASFNNPIALTIDIAGNLYVADFNNNLIRKITPDGTVSTFAGTGAIGFDDGAANVATFNGPDGIVIDHAGNLFVSDNHNVIRKILQDGTVSTFAGKVINTPPGFANGTGADANFYFPLGLAVDAADNIYVADNQNNMIRKITPGAIVTTVTGQLNKGSANGTPLSATFYHPTGVAVDASGNIYVTDNGNNLIRKISTSGDVSTVAGTGAVGGDDGKNQDATFRDIHGIAVNASGVIFVADGYSKIRKINQ